MPVRVSWDNDEKTIVRMQMIGHWTWDEVAPASRIGWGLVENVDHEVDTILDFSQSAGVPMAGISHAVGIIGNRHPRIGLTVFVGTDAMFNSMWNSLQRTYRKSIKEQEFAFAQTLDEAHQILADKRSTLEIPTV